jgi:hypothetical protein
VGPLNARRLFTACSLLLGSGWTSRAIVEHLGIEGAFGVAVPTLIGFAAGLFFMSGIGRPRR